MSQNEEALAPEEKALWVATEYAIKQKVDEIYKLIESCPDDREYLKERLFDSLMTHPELELEIEMILWIRNKISEFVPRLRKGI